MKWPFFIIFLFSFQALAQGLVDPTLPESAHNIGLVIKSNRPENPAEYEAKLKSAMDTLKDAAKRSRETPEYMFEEKSARGCSHCPRYFALTDSVNKVLEEMRKRPDVQRDENVPLSINKLRFLFYMVQGRQANGAIKCQRFMDSTDNLRPTTFDGEMQLVAEDVFKFEGITLMQLIDDKTEEVTYYYRGEGDQKNVIVQAVLTKDGGKFRYYYLNTLNDNPYNLPALSDADLTPRERKKKQQEEERRLREFSQGSTFSVQEADLAQTAAPLSKDKIELNVDPKLEMRNKYIPKDYHLARGSVSQGVLGTGLRMNGDSVLSIKGNKARMTLQNEEGHSYLEMDVNTSMDGKTERRIAIPYEVRLGAKDDKDAMAVKGKVEDQNTVQTLSLTLTDRFTQYFRTDYVRDKTSNKSAVTVAKDFSIGPAESATVMVGRDTASTKFAALQHRKTIKGNITMVLDVRLDENRQASFFYQLHSKF